MLTVSHCWHIRLPLLAALLASLASAPISSVARPGVTWTPIDPARATHVRFFIDEQSIRKNGKALRARILYDFTEAQFNEDLGIYAKSYVVDSQIDCRKKSLAPESMTIYPENQGQGKPYGKTTPEKKLKWTPAHAGTLSGAIVEFACSRKTRL
jgi:hypothetical protein